MALDLHIEAAGIILALVSAGLAVFGTWLAMRKK